MIAAYILIGVFTVLGIFLLFGKGSFLIAGYNTASEEEKKKIDKKKLCRSMGIMLLAVAGLIGAMCVVDTDAFALSMGGIIVLVLAAELIYANRFCVKREKNNETRMR